MADRTFTASRTGSNTWIVSSAIAGVVAGIVFAMFEMIMAAITNGADAFFMPLRMIGGIGLGASALDPSTSLVAAGGAGIVIHMALSMLYGVAVAVVLRAIPSLARTSASVLAVSSAAGFALWVVNFHVLARALGWPWFPDGTNAVVQIVAHTVFFGTVLGLALLRLRAVQPGG
jgi:uncharacterized membrane protein YagU involved in acid resistance